MILLFLLACFFMYKQAKKLVIKKVSVNLGVKIVLLSDLHFDTVLVNYREIIEKICEVKPEVIVITGDLCSKMKYFYRVEAFLTNLSNRISCPILITLGNHDNMIFENQKYKKEEYIRKLQNLASTISVLENSVFIYKDWLFGGLEDFRSNKSDCGYLTKKWKEESEKSNKKLIILTHNPDMVLNLNKNNAPEILLAGHTHGGQMRVPFNIEFALLKKDILPKKKIFYGLQEYNDIRMYITSGIGCSALPFRFRSVAEIAVIQ